MACHKRVACVDISSASMFPWQCVTGRDTCSKEWGGGKVSRRNRTPRNNFPPPENIEAHEDFYSEFWVRRAENTYFFFPVGTLVQCLQKLLSQGGSLVVEKQPRPSFRLMHVLKPIVSHRT